jgi:hypothetical protein
MPYTVSPDNQHSPASYTVNNAPPPIQAGEIVTVISQSENGWWDGMIGSPNRRGWFPYNYVRLIADTPSRRTSRFASL